MEMTTEWFLANVVPCECDALIWSSLRSVISPYRPSTARKCSSLRVSHMFVPWEMFERLWRVLYASYEMSTKAEEYTRGGTLDAWYLGWYLECMFSHMLLMKGRLKRWSTPEVVPGTHVPCPLILKRSTGAGVHIGPYGMCDLRRKKKRWYRQGHHSF